MVKDKTDKIVKKTDLQDSENLLALNEGLNDVTQINEQDSRDFSTVAFESSPSPFVDASSSSTPPVSHRSGIVYQSPLSVGESVADGVVSGAYRVPFDLSPHGEFDGLKNFTFLNPDSLDLSRQREDFFQDANNEASDSNNFIAPPVFINIPP